MGALVSGRTAVAAAGTAVALSTSSKPIDAVWVMAATGNTNPVTIGGSDVVGALATRKGIALRQTDPPLRLTPADGVDELGDVWVDAITNTDAVTWFYAPRT